METIKLVIWDLDDTFWSGTLSEGGIQYRPEHHEIVVELSRRGIVNSICSKNDLQSASEALRAHGIWDFFVFPKIDWSPKGEMIAWTLEEMGLRPANVLFVDDNPQNLEEARFYNPGIQVAAPDGLASLLDQAAVRGKDDAGLSRLKQYQLLEKKVSDRQQFKSSNEDFLRQCGIQVDIRGDCPAAFDRILELIQRTNQLNFTKRLLDAEQLRALLDDSDCQCAYVQVRDDYGDYGVAGFYALRGRRLEQFLFSCRVLNMGVERWIYNQLGRPELTIAGEVSDDPTLLPVPDWIKAAGSDTAQSAEPAIVGKFPRVLLKGGCDLELVIDFLGRQNGAIGGEFNYVTSAGVPAHTEHTEILRRANADVATRHAEAYARLRFLDDKSYETRFFSDPADVFVYSALMDMSAGLYRYAQTDWLLPYGDFKLDITDPSNWDRVLSQNAFFDREFLTWFREHFTFEGCLSETAFRDNLHWLCARIPREKQLILLNAAEIALEHPYEHRRDEHHRRMNAVLEEVVAAYPHVDLCDVRKFAKTAADVSNNIRHYRRGVYYNIAGELRELIASRWSLRSRPVVEMLQGSLGMVSVWGKSALWAMAKRIRRVAKGRSSNRVT
jgi:FkbH-like protein